MQPQCPPVPNYFRALPMQTLWHLQNFRTDLGSLVSTRTINGVKTNRPLSACLPPALSPYHGVYCLIVLCSLIFFLHIFLTISSATTSLLVSLNDPLTPT